jgi:phosphinothricin acetyltransferase
VQIRAMEPGDAESVAAIYNEGIRGRGATFQTREQSAADVAPWVDQAERYPVVVAERDGQVVGWARASSYSAFGPYRGVGELAIYVASPARGGGIGGALVEGLCDACRVRGYWKLIAKVFPANETSVDLLRGRGFRDVGLHIRHGQIDGEWRDVQLLERSL